MSINSNIDIRPKITTEERDFTQEREVFLWGFIGHNRTGKTSTAVELARNWKEGRPDGTVVAFDPQHKFEDVADYFILPSDKDWAYKALDLRNALLILDDYRILHPSDRASQDLLNLLSFRNEYSIDIMYVCHSPALVLNVLTYYTTNYFLFYTQSRMGIFEKKIPNYTICQGASQYVNKYVKTFGKGDYPNFPYVVVDNQEEKIYAINMSNQF